MSWPSPPRSRHSLAITADLATSAIAAAPPSRSVLGTTGSAPTKVISPPVSAGLMPMPASTSDNSACGSNASVVSGFATAAATLSVSDIPRLLQQLVHLLDGRGSGRAASGDGDRRGGIGPLRRFRRRQTGGEAGDERPGVRVA